MKPYKHTLLLLVLCAGVAACVDDRPFNTDSGVEESTLTGLTVVQSTNGNITSSGNEINCGTGGPDCYMPDNNGVVTVLTATADSGSSFDSWINCSAPISGQCQINIVAGGSQTVAAVFVTPKPAANIQTDWVLNTNNEPSAFLAGGAYLVNVQAVNSTLIDRKHYVQVRTSGVPNYQLTMQQDLIDSLNQRPRATASNSDFLGLGRTTASMNQAVAFGENINYRSDSSDIACGAGQGYGYWPPGSGCPTDQNKLGLFPLLPIPADVACETADKAVGYALNGVSIFNWSDGQSYRAEQVWQTLAPLAEAYDLDICGGHALDGEYHHHAYSECWADAAGEDFVGHSEAYGYAADGYAVYGPYQNTAVLAQTCWKPRDYTTGPADPGYGCVGFNGAAPGERNCLLVDAYDPGQGVVVASLNGPTTAGSFTSQSQNVYLTSAGFFKQDYYYDASCSAQGEAYLDQYNGHADPLRGYHYHLTLAPAGNALVPVYPFVMGPRYRGELQAGAIASCAKAVQP